MLKVSKCFIILLINCLFFIFSCTRENSFIERVKTRFCISNEIFDSVYIYPENNLYLKINRKNLILSNEEAFEGMYSIKMDSLYNFALTIRSVELYSNKKYVLSFWVYPYNDKVYAVCQKDNIFYIASSKRAILSKNKWQKVELVFSIPDTLNGQKFDMYIWNNSRKTLYVDNFELKEINISNE